ncbi:class I SAM-dependent methyltransferase [Oleiagrimonas soli]|uniref:16S rRNA (Guanine1207-N2)-methyltransferase n=1 Tax=Oleiagrimonas soli TaxID=1543381 RepID=A0A099CWV0_9GAMM|nr:class I SAM-dependent methyltransferase [Oleiagrimonas soli]KGI78224.1 16S rRNA methyltransferase [Oleiagrimonas soli]MBB6183313.1 16S rRNA (guanine1207-N2)-methyltransferase [Oleiagrimonas soli]
MTATVRQDENAALQAMAETLAEPALASRANGRVLFLRAQAGALDTWPGARHWTCVQSFRPWAQPLLDAGRSVHGEIGDIGDERFDLTLVLPPKQRDEARAWLAHAVAHTKSDGVIVAAMPNQGGARSGERDLQRLTDFIEHRSRSKCRVFWSDLEHARIDAEVLSSWLALDAAQPILDGRFVSRPGLFAWDRIDVASALLAEHLPSTLRGHVADLGAGYGYLSVELLQRAPGITALDLYEAEARALEPARRNMEQMMHALGRTMPVHVHWHDVARGLPARYDVIVSNPPFHQGRADRPELGQAFIRAAAEALRPQGVLWMVANRHLPYEAVLGEAFASVRTVVERDGFKVIEAVRA